MGGVEGKTIKRKGKKRLLKEKKEEVRRVRKWRECLGRREERKKKRKRGETSSNREAGGVERKEFNCTKCANKVKRRDEEKSG